MLSSAAHGRLFSWRLFRPDRPPQKDNYDRQNAKGLLKTPRSVRFAYVPKHHVIGDCPLNHRAMNCAETDTFRQIFHKHVDL